MTARQWQKNQGKPFVLRRGRRVYLCPHDRRRDSCRECCGLDFVLDQMYNAARFRARRDQVPFTIMRRDLDQLWGSGICPVFGVPMVFSTSGHQGGDDFSPSLDRFIPANGYTMENCSIISNLANRVKYSASVEQVQAVADWMKKVKGCCEVLCG